MRTSGTSPACFHLPSLVGIYFKDLLEYREYSVFSSQGGRGVMDFQRKAPMRLVLFLIGFLKRGLAPLFPRMAFKLQKYWRKAARGVQ